MFEENVQICWISFLGKVRDFIMCQDCGKRRVIYCKTKLTRSQESAIQRVQEELLYICGNCLFPGGEFQDLVLVREGISCSSTIEATYYAGIYLSLQRMLVFFSEIYENSVHIIIVSRHFIPTPFGSKWKELGFQAFSVRSTKKYTYGYELLCQLARQLSLQFSLAIELTWHVTGIYELYDLSCCLMQVYQQAHIVNILISHM